MLFLTLAGKLHSLRSLPPNCPPTSITPSSLRPLTSDPHFVITSPHPPWPQALVPQNTTGLTRVSLSPPKSAAQLSILRGSLAELGRTEVPLQTHFATSLLITTLGLLLADSQPLKKKQAKISQQNVVLGSLRQRSPLPTPQAGNVANDSKPSCGGETQSTHGETEQTSETELKQHVGNEKSPKNCPNPVQCPASPGQLRNANVAPQNSSLQIPM